jgi:hypothetical protein
MLEQNLESVYGWVLELGSCSLGGESPLPHLLKPLSRLIVSPLFVEDSWPAMERKKLMTRKQ